MTDPAPSPREFWCEVVPAQFNRRLEAQAALGEEGEALHRAMMAVDGTLQVEVAGPGGGRFFLNIAKGRMEAGTAPSGPPFLTLLQDHAAFERLALEAGDSVLGLLGGLAGLSEEMPLTRDRVETLRKLDGLLHFEVTGSSGFVVRTHFGSGPRPDTPSATVLVDESVFRDLRAGELDLETAFLDARIRVDGDMGLAMRLALAAAAPDGSVPG